MCARVCMRIAMLLLPLVEEMLPFSSTTLRLSVYIPSWSGSGDSGEVWSCRKEHSQTRGVGSGRHQAKEKTNTRERGVVSSSLACLLLQLRKEECANCCFRAETMSAHFFLLFSFLFSILLPQFPDSPRQILITCSALIFPVFRKSVANALWVICFINAQDICWFLG